jgi:hypothetical protein
MGMGEDNRFAKIIGLTATTAHGDGLPVRKRFSSEFLVILSFILRPEEGNCCGDFIDASQEYRKACIRD